MKYTSKPLQKSRKFEERSKKAAARSYEVVKDGIKPSRFDYSASQFVAKYVSLLGVVFALMAFVLCWSYGVPLHQKIMLLGDTFDLRKVIILGLVIGPTSVVYISRWIIHWVAKARAKRLQRKADLEYQKFNDRYETIQRFVDGMQQVINTFSESKGTVNHMCRSELDDDLESVVEEMKTELGKEFNKLKDSERQEMITEMLLMIRPERIQGLSANDVEHIKCLFTNLMGKSR